MCAIASSRSNSQLEYGDDLQVFEALWVTLRVDVEDDVTVTRRGDVFGEDYALLLE